MSKESETDVIQNEERKLKKSQERELKKKRYLLAGMDVVNTVKEIVTGKKVITEENEYIKEYYILSGTSVSKHSPYSKVEKVTFISIGLIILNVVLLITRYIYAYVNLQEIIFCNSFFYIIPVVALPFMIWIRSTNENFWAFHERKRLFFYLCTINTVLVIFQRVYTRIWKIIVPLVLKIPTNPCLTKKMILLLAYIVVFVFFSIVAFVVYRQIQPIILSETTRHQIEIFKLQHIRDNRESRQYKYDITTIKSLETGQPIRVKENDRFVQTEINGASGTGKTSTIFLGVIRSDLDQKAKNREKRQEEMMQMLINKKATLQGPLREFEEEAVIPIGRTKNEYKKNQKQLVNIKEKYPDCGMTIVAPNPSMITDIIRMCVARGIQKINVLDPTGNYEMYENVREVAINPFYLPLNIDEEERVIRISNASSVFADVLIATNQMGGQSDVYFTDISLSVSSNIAAIVMLAKNIEGEQAYIDDVHECISNFDNLKPYVEIIEKHFGITVEVSQAIGKNAGKITSESIMDMLTKPTNPQGVKEAKKNPYYQQILFVKQELLGDGKEAMFSQARGLRNLITKILQDPRIKNKLSARDEDRIDFDAILAKNEITLVSTAIELGQNISTSFGLFFLLLHRTSVLRRPKELRTPHFLWIDECAQYVHPFFDDVIALYRQYRVAAVLTLQTLTQLEKHNATAYLKNVFLGAGTHIVFGRLATEEMKLYSEMAGITREMQEQKTWSANSVLASNPNYSESVRTTPTITNNMEGADMRMLDFLELTIFTVDNGRVLPGQFGRVFFIGPDAYDTQKTKTFLWEKAVPEAFREDGTEFIGDVCEVGQESIKFEDEILSDAQEQLLIKTVPAENRLEDDEMKKMNLNELYQMLIDSGTEESKV